MVPGSGYWLKVSADGTWTVGTVSESGSGRGLGKMGPVHEDGLGPCGDLSQPECDSAL